MPDSHNLNAIRKDFVDDPVRRFDKFANDQQTNLGHYASEPRKLLKLIRSFANPFRESFAATSRERVSPDDEIQEGIFSF